MRQQHDLGSFSPDALLLTRGTADDVAFVMATERLPEYEQLLARWTQSQHHQALADGRHAYFIARLNSEAVGFAIIRDWASPEGVAHIKRVAVRHPGRGHGTALLTNLVEVIFRETNAYRIWLGVFPENVRAQRAYEAVGFQAEGIARGSAYFGAVRRDELIISLLRPEWSIRSGKIARRGK